jgi:hypothetical protein
MNKDLIEPLKELEFLLREQIIFSDADKSEILAVCGAIINNIMDKEYFDIE